MCYTPLTHTFFCQSNTTVTELDLSDNGLGTEGGLAITTMLKENCYITHLVIYHLHHMCDTPM